MLVGNVFIILSSLKAFMSHLVTRVMMFMQVYRTRGSSVPWQGRVEARVNREWGTIGDLGWDVTDASVVCRSLGFGSAKTATYFSNFGRGVGKIHYSSLKYVMYNKTACVYIYIRVQLYNLIIRIFIYKALLSQSS